HDAGDARRSGDLGLGESGTADAEGPGGHLPAGDLDRFADLEARTEGVAVRLRMLGHVRDVVVQHVQVQYQGRGFQPVPGSRLADQPGVRPPRAPEVRHARYLPSRGYA